MHAAVLSHADYVHVCYRDRGQVVHDEVLCHDCYDALERAGAFRKARNSRGQQTEVKPWHGEERCSGCEANR